MSFTTLYRPKRIAEILGQHNVKRALSNILRAYTSTGQMPRSLICCGEYGTGKTTVARIIARYSNCYEGPLKACLQCPSCLAMETGRHPDLWEVDAVSHSSVEDIPAFKEWIQFKTHYRRKFLILDEAHRLSDKAWDALLKVMEEGTENVTFILCTTETEKIKDTIRSRSTELNFFKLSAIDLKELILGVAQKNSISFRSEEVLGHVIRRSGGHARDALKYLEQIAGCANVEGMIDEEAIAFLTGTTYFDEAKEFIRAVFGSNEPELHVMLVKMKAFEEDFCVAVLEVLRQELFNRSLNLKSSFEVSDEKLVRFTGFVEDTFSRLLMGESLATLIVAYERWKLGVYLEIT